MIARDGRADRKSCWVMSMSYPRCSAPECSGSAPSLTGESKPLCPRCIRRTYQLAGLDPIDLPLSAGDRRRACCQECGAESVYSFRHVALHVEDREPACDHCYLSAWGRRRRNYKPARAGELRNMLTRPTGLREDEQEAFATDKELRGVLDQWWWPVERTVALTDLHHHDLVADSDPVNDGMSPVLLRCRRCGESKARLPGRLQAELAEDSCLCSCCDPQGGGCSPGMEIAFASYGLEVREPLPRPQDIQHATCSQCARPRRVSLSQLDRGVPHCHTCDGMTSPDGHRDVVTLHYPNWGVFGVTIAPGGQHVAIGDEMMGGRVVDAVAVPHRTAARRLERLVVETVRPWPTTGEPGRGRLRQWTSMWQDSAPVRVRLSDHLERARSVMRYNGISTDWSAHNTEPIDLSDSAATQLQQGDTVCFTGAGAGRTRAQWSALAEGAGLRPVGSVSAKCGLLVVPDATASSTKVRSAVKHGVPVVTYEEFLRSVPA